MLTLVARGWSNAEIAERLYLSPATAKTHVGRLLTKLQARDRTPARRHRLRDRAGHAELTLTSLAPAARAGLTQGTSRSALRLLA